MNLHVKAQKYYINNYMEVKSSITPLILLVYNLNKWCKIEHAFSGIP